MNNEEDLENPKTLQEEKPEETEVEKTEESEKSTVEKPEQSKELQSALAQKEHFRKKYEESQKELGKPKSNISTADPMEVVHLTKALEGFNEDEVEFITRNASEKSIQGTIDASKDDWVKTAIQARREKVESENKIPEPTTRTTTYNKTPISEMKGNELESNFGEVIKKVLRNGKERR